MSDKKTALVTGANKRLGYEIVAGLGARGYRMAVGVRDNARGEAAVKMLNAAGVDAFVVPLDVTSDRSVAEAAQLIERQGGRSADRGSPRGPCPRTAVGVSMVRSDESAGQAP